MGNSASTPAPQPTLSEKHASSTRASFPSSAADLLSQLSLRGSAASRASAKVTSENLAAWEGDFASSPKHRLASTVLSKAALTDSLVRRDAQRDTQQFFNVKVNEGGLPITNQKSSGRCWLFSATNLLRIALARKLDLDDFQFSQSYLFFWDSLSKANYFLEQMLDLADSPLDDRVVQHLMTMPENDGGQWSMLDSLITTFGLVPQVVYPESFNSSNTGKLDALLASPVYLVLLLDRASLSLANVNKDFAQHKLFDRNLHYLRLFEGPASRGRKVHSRRRSSVSRLKLSRSRANQREGQTAHTAPPHFRRFVGAPLPALSLVESGSKEKESVSLVGEPRGEPEKQGRRTGRT